MQIRLQGKKGEKTNGIWFRDCHQSSAGITEETNVRRKKAPLEAGDLKGFSIDALAALPLRNRNLLSLYRRIFVQVVDLTGTRVTVWHHATNNNFRDDYPLAKRRVRVCRDFASKHICRSGLRIQALVWSQHLQNNSDKRFMLFLQTAVNS